MRPHPSTAAERIVWIGHLLAHEGEYGAVSALACRIAASRQTLTTWRERGRRALTERMVSPRPVPDAAALERNILTLLVEGHASYRGVQACLAELLGWQVSLATIAAVVAEAGGARRRCWANWRRPPRWCWRWTRCSGVPPGTAT